MKPLDALGVVMDRRLNYGRVSVALANELEALDAWLDAECSDDAVAGPTCYPDHHEGCPVEIARKALVSANAARRKL